MNLRYETKKFKQGYRYIIGCDEVGRGSLAGPVVASAVILPMPEANDKSKVESYKVIKSCGIKDSKLLSAEKRQELEPIIKQNALAWGMGVVSEKIIDEINIYNASLLAMKKAVENLLSANSCELADGVFLAVDGKFEVPQLAIKQEAVIDGDNKIISIAAASIIAKVYRDNLMRKAHKSYPIYNFFQHKGYATEYHRKTIIKEGLSPIHRLSFCGQFM